MVLQQILPSDGREGYAMLQRLGPNENNFTNPINGKSFEEYKQWLVQQDKWSRDEDLPEGYVGQTCFWFIVDGIIVGLGKIRHQITPQSRIEGGNIGFAIDPGQRGKGFANRFAALLLNKAQEMGIEEILLTIKKNNNPSKAAFERNGCKVVKETNDWWYLSK